MKLRQNMVKVIITAAAVGAISASAAVVDNGLFLAHWNTSTTAGNGAGLPVVPTGGTAAISTVAPQFGGGALDLTSVGGGLQYSTAGNFNPTTGTVELWIKPSVANYLTAASHGILYNGPDGLNQWNLRVAGGGLQFVMTVGGTAYTVAPALAPWAQDTWHQVAVTWGSGGIQLYADGTNIGSNPFTGFAPTAATLYLGTIFGNQASATFDELLITSNQRSAAQILADYNSLDEFYFAPEPGVVSLLAVGGLLVWRRMRK